MLIKYLKSSKFKKNIPEWIAVLALLLIFFYVVEPARPFQRQFKLSDPTLQHPFATTERVTDNQLYMLSCILPFTIILVITNFRRTNNVNLNNFHVLQVSLLGLFVSLSVNGVITDILKNWIGRPRPDFLARCGPTPTTPPNTYVGIEVCTAPLGQIYLLDGGKSTPSGHASLSFAGLFYLYLWIIGQFKLRRESYLWQHLVAIIPIILASYVGLSRTQDYRHHFLDIILGSGIGISVAFVVYFRYFPYLNLENSNVPITVDDDILPT